MLGTIFLPAMHPANRGTIIDLNNFWMVFVAPNAAHPDALRTKKTVHSITIQLLLQIFSQTDLAVHN